MKLEKAYDYFSAYYEGTLDAALRHQMDRLFEANQRLRHDFESFAASLEDLELGKGREVEIPLDLHERIVSRLDRSIYESSRNQPQGFMAFWRRYALGGLATVVIIGGGLAIANRGNGNQAAAGFTEIPSAPISVVGLEVVGEADGAFLRFSPTSNDSVKVMRLPDAKVMQSYEVSANTKLDVPLKNSAQEPVTLLISTAKGSEMVVVIPGTQKQSAGKGQGTLLDFAKAMSATYLLPVTLDSAKRDSMFRWNLDDSSVTQPQTTPEGVTVELKEKLIRIRF
jgi:hypothetical protein